MSVEWKDIESFLTRVRDNFENIPIRVKRDKWDSLYLNECSTKELFNWMIEFLKSRLLCPHGTFGGRRSCMACRPELIKKRRE